ncbi:hypothetical protein QCA50_011222 [Cerrena zonata]|uniref:Uncharacterized protein n=1 Tax=Cerrena zonata TaxID=2478898 RepID=A0AAW0FXD5_9APHY
MSPQFFVDGHHPTMASKLESPLAVISQRCHSNRPEPYSGLLSPKVQCTHSLRYTHRNDYADSRSRYKSISALIKSLTDSVSISLHSLNALQSRKRLKTKLKLQEVYRGPSELFSAYLGDKPHADWNTKPRERTKESLGATRMIEDRLSEVTTKEKAQALGAGIATLETLCLFVSKCCVLATAVFALYEIAKYGTWKYESLRNVPFWVSIFLDCYAVVFISESAKDLAKLVKATEHFDRLYVLNIAI